MKNKLIKVVAIFLAVLCIGGIFMGCKKKEQSELVKITLSEVTHSVFFAPQYAAMELGFFKENGIELELINGGGADKVMSALLSGGVQIGLAGPEAAIYVYKEGKEDYAEVFAQLTKRDGSFLMGRVPEPDFKWENIRGKYLIGGRKGGVPQMTLEYVIKQNKLDANKDFTMDTGIAFNLMTGAFAGGTGDYVTIFEPTASMFEAEGKGYILTSIGEESGEIPYTVYFASKSYIAENEEIIKSFTKAVKQGQEWVAKASPADIAKTITPYFADTDIKILEAVVKRYKDIDAWNTTPFMKEEAFNRLQEVMESAGELSGKVPYDKLFNPKFSK